jgi:hypothetical protein
LRVGAIKSVVRKRKERAVLNDRASYRTAELSSVKLGHISLKIIAGAQILIGEEVKGASVKCIGA